MKFTRRQKVALIIIAVAIIVSVAVIYYPIVEFGRDIQVNK
jgi:hypothetical protein